LQDNYITLVSLLLPEGILEYFDITEAGATKEGLSIYLEEKNIAPLGYTAVELQSKGFHVRKITLKLIDVRVLFPQMIPVID
jgi:hypothetical protein